MQTSLPPVAVGGVGGSGTRLVAKILQALDVHIGADLNAANDTLWFTLLFKRTEILQCGDPEFDLLTRMLLSGLHGGQPLDPSAHPLLETLSGECRQQHPTTWLKARAQSLRLAATRSRLKGRFGWKEPNTHVVIERLWQRMQTLRYIHVVRHGMDMAYSRNQNQLKLWGTHVLGTDAQVTPARSLAYWCRVHQRMQRLLVHNPQRMYWLDYDALCRDPGPVLDDMCRFLGHQAGRADIVRDMILQHPPRHTLHPVDAFAPADVEYVRSLGYRVDISNPPAAGC